MKYSFDPNAQAEYIEAIQYYEQQAEGLGIRFIQDVENTLGRILAFPETWGLIDKYSKSFIEYISVWNYISL